MEGGQVIELLKVNYASVFCIKLGCQKSLFVAQSSSLKSYGGRRNERLAVLFQGEVRGKALFHLFSPVLC